MGKGPAVERMFDAIAGRYDLMNRLMTFGRDRAWRAFVVERAGPVGDGWVLDLACGTGDIARLFRKTAPAGRIIGADFSGNMLAEARRRSPGREIAWHACDANRLPYAENVFTAVSFGYLLRNVDDVLVVLREVHRVLAPGGRVVCLDTTPPRPGVIYPFVQLYLRFAVPLLGRMVARDEAAYAYLSGSTMSFHSAEELAELFRRAGFGAVRFRRFMAGTIAVHWGRK